MIEYEVTTLSSDLVKRIELLGAMHFEEVEAGRTGTSMDLDYSAYDSVSDSVVILATEGEEIVGYAVFLIQPYHRSKGNLIAIEEAYFVHPLYRGNSVGSSLLDLAEFEIKVQYPEVSHIMIGMPSESPIMDHLGYSLDEYVYMKKV